ncbi:MAG: class III extradiol ring-cleavage dioxygenase [Pseudomonadota bacterium]
MASLPTLFVSHGAPTLALAPGKTGEALAALARALPRPRAVLMISAHWDTAAPRLSAAAAPATLHDFYGFPEALYRIRYPAPGAPELARRVQALLQAAGLPAALDTQRGLDHGAWVPLRLMYPEADIPVAQLSLQSGRGAAHHHRLGAALAPVGDEDVLVIGSGSMTHNLGDLAFDAPAAEAVPYVGDFRAWMHDRLAEGDVAALLDYRRRAPGARRAHPTEEHLAPLFAALGAAGERSRARRVHNEVSYGALAMDAYLFEPRPGA